MPHTLIRISTAFSNYLHDAQVLLALENPSLPWDAKRMHLYQGGCLIPANVCLPDSYHSSAPFPGNVSDTPLMVKVCPLSVSPSPRHISRNRGARRHHVPGHTRENTRTPGPEIAGLHTALLRLLHNVTCQHQFRSRPGTGDKETRDTHVTCHHTCSCEVGS